MPVFRVARTRRGLRLFMTVWLFTISRFVPSVYPPSQPPPSHRPVYTGGLLLSVAITNALPGHLRPSLINDKYKCVEVATSRSCPFGSEKADELHGIPTQQQQQHHQIAFAVSNSRTSAPLTHGATYSRSLIVFQQNQIAGKGLHGKSNTRKRKHPYLNPMLLSQGQSGVDPLTYDTLR